MAPSLLLTVLLPLTASAGGWRELSSTLETHAAAWGVAPQQAPVAAPLGHRALPRQPDEPIVTLGAPALVTPLAPILNAYWRSSIRFQAGSVSVLISGTKSSNGDKDWFLTLCAEPCEPPVFKRGKDFLRYRFLGKQVLDRRETVSFGGRDFVITLDGQLRNREASKLKIQETGGPSTWEWEVRQIADAFYQTGTLLRLREAEFRLFYLDEVVQDEQGKFAGFSGKRTLLFMTVEKNKYVPYLFRESELAPGRMMVFARAAEGDDNRDKKPLRLGLALSDDGRLAVYDAEPPKRR